MSQNKKILIKNFNFDLPITLIQTALISPYPVDLKVLSFVVLTFLKEI